MATLRQQKLYEIIGTRKNMRGISWYRILIEVGYSESVARNPQLVLQGKGYQELMSPNTEKDLSLYKEMAENMHLLLHAVKTKNYTFPLEMSDEEIKDLIDGTPGHKCLWIKRDNRKVVAKYSVPDGSMRIRAIVLNLKIRGYFEEQKLEKQRELKAQNDELDNMTDEEMLRASEELKRVLAYRNDPNCQLCPNCRQIIPPEGLVYD